MSQLEKLLDSVKYQSKEKRELITRAYHFVEKAHAYRHRNGKYLGAAYLEHAVKTAETLAEIGMGRNTISAGILHHVLTDTNVSSEEFQKEFGRKILFLVEGVSKLENIRYAHEKHHIESFIKFFLISSQNLRILIIRLADRLDILRYRRFVNPNRLKSVARETMSVYVPIAGHLGIRSIQRELEDLSFKILEPEHYETTRRLIARKEKKDHKNLVRFQKSVLKIITAENIKGAEVHFRLKSVYSVYTKLIKAKKEADKIYDIKALRVNMRTIADCYAALGVIHRHFRPVPGRIKDYIANPKRNGYQSLHTTVMTGNGRDIAEIQIRTFDMHDVAEFGTASHSEYKNDDEKIIGKWFNSLFFSPKNSHVEKGVDAHLQKVPKWMSEFTDPDRYRNVQRNFYESLKFNFPDEYIFAFDPQGIVIDLPKGATVIDFAFALDPKRAFHLYGAKINKKFVSLQTKLCHNDVVELQTKPSAHPTPKWLPFAKTSFARNSINEYLKQDSKG